MAESSSSKELPPDIYEPLDKDTREIRLFEIIPSQDTNATIEIRLFRRRLDDVSTRFIPFSYVWGDAKDTKPIEVNGISTEVTHNLADFLKQTRSLLPDILTKGSWHKPAIFWADAICINQKDPEERNHQVQLLKSIYSSAPLVLAWLGHFSDAHLAVSLAESLDMLYLPDFYPNLSSMDYSFWMGTHPHLWKVPGSRNAHWSAFKALGQSPYWTRTWTFQEMALPTDILYMCGSSLIKWQSIMAVQQLLTALISLVTTSRLPAHRALYSALDRFLTVSGPSIYTIDNTRHELVSGVQPPNLTLVPLLAHHQATDPRDKVYGLLGVIETRLEADYTKDTSQVYSEFVSAWIDEVKDLNFLSYCYEHHRIAWRGPNSLPSWAPDWEAISRKEWDSSKFLNFGLFMAAQFDSHDASEALPTRNTHLCDNLSTLVAPGVRIGKVEEIYPCWPSDTSNAEFALDVLQLAIKYASRFGLQLEPSGSPPGPRRHIFQALFRTIIPHVEVHSMLDIRYVHLQPSLSLCFLVGFLAWVVDSECPDWHSVAATYLPPFGIPVDQDFSRAWKEDIFKDYSPENNMLDWEDAAVAMKWTWEYAKEPIQVLREHLRMYLGRPLKFITYNGYIGTAIAAQAGDLVVVLAGCKAPVLLRRKGSHYEHVGPCFVVGLMEGEAKQMVDRGEAKVETFEIR